MCVYVLEAPTDWRVGLKHRYIVLCLDVIVTVDGLLFFLSSIRAVVTVCEDQ